MTVIGSGRDIVVEGNKCDKGIEFAKTEVNHPARTLTTTVRTNFPGVPVLPVRTDGEIPKEKIPNVMHELSKVVVKNELGCGDVLLEDAAGTGIPVIVTGYTLMRLGAELENKNIELGGGAGSAAGAVVTKSAGAGIAADIGVLDSMGTGVADADGFVGAAGSAVGVENEGTDDDDIDEAQEESGGERIKRQSRPHIKRK